MDPTNSVAGSPLIKANMPNPSVHVGSENTVENVKPAKDAEGKEVNKRLQAEVTDANSDNKLAEDGKKEIDTAVENVNDFFQTVNRTLEFKLDEDSETMVVQVTDSETKEVVRQIPSEEFLQLAQRLEEFRGLLFEEIA